MGLEKTIFELKKIVEKLEDQQLSMDESLALYKQGIELSQQCDVELAELKGKIEILNENFEPIDGGEVEND